MPVLKTVIEPKTKDTFRAIAKSRNLSESELLRTVILVVTGEGVAVEKVAVREQDKTELDRLTVRMPSFLLETTKAQAKSKGMATSRFISSLVQSNLTKTPVMTDKELSELNASNRELAAIGRNINQIARALNSSFHETERVKLEKLAELHRIVIETRASIRALVRSSQNAWDANNEHH